MPELITPADLPRWVPGEITCASDALDWQSVFLRAYRYRGQDVHIPPVRDHLIVSYRRGRTPMERSFEGAWTQTRCAPGSISLLTRAQRSRWNWSERVDVCHVYLPGHLLDRVASEALGHVVTNLRLRDVLNVEDPVLTHGVETLQREVHTPGLGGSLYAEAIAAQLALHLVRHYAECEFKGHPGTGVFSASQRGRLLEYIESRLQEPLSLMSLAEVLGLGLATFTRRFRASFGQPPHAYVLGLRVARARQLVTGTLRPLKEIALECGFADQAHMTRAFRARHGTTPGMFRNARRNGD